jgi:tripartite-type tricarboxylate transporter receptor subunit TctC
VALTYLYGQDGDPHYLTPTLNSIVTTPLQQKIPVMYTSRDLTPVAMMTTDPFLMWVHPDKYSSWEEFHAACKANRLTATGTGARAEDEIHINLIQEAAGCQPFRYVPQSGGGVVASNVAGGHSDFNVNQPAEALPHYPDNLIPIVMFAKERHATVDEAPTHWELEIGTDMEAMDGQTYAELLDVETGLHQVRGLIGPPNMPEDAKAFYDDMFKQVFDSPEWQEFMETNGMIGTYQRPRRLQGVPRDLRDQPRPHDARRLRVGTPRRPGRQGVVSESRQRRPVGAAGQVLAAPDARSCCTAAIPHSNRTRHGAHLAESDQQSGGDRTGPHTARSWAW